MKSFAIVVGVWGLGEVFSLLIKPVILIPGSIMGMILMFVFLKTKLIKLEMVEDIAGFFLQHITLFIIPFGVAFVKYWDVIRSNIFAILLCGVVATIISLILTMKFVDLLIDITKKSGDEV